MEKQVPHRGRLTVQERLAAQYLALGMGAEEACSQAELPHATYARVKGDPLFLGELDRCRARAFPLLVDRLTSRLEALQEPALERMADLMQAESEPVQFQAAKDLLNRGPLAPKVGYAQGQGQGAGATIHLDQQALQAILGGAMNMGLPAIVTAFSSLSLSPPEAPRDVTPPPSLHDLINQPLAQDDQPPSSLLEPHPSLRPGEGQGASPFSNDGWPINRYLASLTVGEEE